MFVEQTHDVSDILPTHDQPLRFTDTRLDEQKRLISVKMMPVSLVMPSTKGKSYLINFMDTPGTHGTRCLSSHIMHAGHVNFNDEVSASMRLADGILLVVDAVEGVMIATQRAIQQAAAEQLALCLVVTKVDRLITELKLPPGDAYFKLKHTIKEVNDEVAKYYGDQAVKVGGDAVLKVVVDCGMCVTSCCLHIIIFTVGPSGGQRRVCGRPGRLVVYAAELCENVCRGLRAGL